jgi:hypothetical protein
MIQIQTPTQTDICYWLKYFDPYNCHTDIRKLIPDSQIPWIIDHYELDKHNAVIYNIRWNWEHKNYSDKQRWAVICEASKKEKLFYE